MGKYIIYLENDGTDVHKGNTSVHSHLQSEYVMRERRRMMKTVNSVKNGEFCQKHGIAPIYSCRYCGCIISELDEHKIEIIKNDTDTRAVYVLGEKHLIHMQTDQISRQIHTDSISGSHSAGFGGSTEGYLGNNITLGAVSAQNLTYIPESLQLRIPEREGRLITVSEKSIPIRESEHSSVVASIIIGSEVRKGGVVYRGASPLSRLYIAPSSGVASMIAAVEKCIDNGAVIINYSAGEYFSDGRYDEFDRLVDTLIYNVGFLFVVSAGNSKYVSSPATCCNGVAVGNAETKINEYQEASRPYNMFFVSEDDCSAYEHDGALPSKPDIAAPGTYIHYIDSYGNISFSRYGTSYAAPYVSSVAAQLAQKYPDAKLNSMLLKALLVCGADGNAVSTTGNPEYGENNILRLKSGAGFLDSVEALQITDGFGGRMYDTESVKRKIFLARGESVRASLCYLVDPSKDTRKNIILEILSPDGRTEAVSDDKRENVKLIAYTSEIGGEYTLSFGADSNDGSESVLYGIAWRIY